MYTIQAGGLISWFNLFLRVFFCRVGCDMSSPWGAEESIKRDQTKRKPNNIVGVKSKLSIITVAEVKASPMLLLKSLF